MTIRAEPSADAYSQGNTCDCPGHALSSDIQPEQPALGKVPCFERKHKP